MRRTTVTTWLTGLAATAVIFVGGQAFMAANAVPASKAGDGEGAISGYVLSSVKYNLNASTPSNVDSVTFTLDSTPAAGSTIKTQLASTGAWYTCSNVAANVTCATTAPQATVTAATNLRVVIAQ